MKNEEKIIELLTEMVRRSDRQEEKYGKHEERIKQLEEIASATVVLLKDVMSRSGETDELRDRIERLEKYTGMK